MRYFLLHGIEQKWGPLFTIFVVVFPGIMAILLFMIYFIRKDYKREVLGKAEADISKGGGEKK